MLNETINAGDEKLLRKQLTFNGEWLPDVDPLKVGDANYTDIQNLRYTETEVMGVGGYTAINTTLLSAYPKGRSGIQLRTPFTTKSFVAVQQFDSSFSASKIYVNQSTPPGTGDFEVTALFTDSVGAGVGHFTELPLSQVMYHNGVDMKIYGGDEQPVAAFIRCDSISGLTPVNPYDYTERILNTLQNSANIVTLSAAHPTALIASTKPLNGIKLYVSSPNTTASVLSGNEWTGSAWSALALTDNTSSGGVAIAQTGTVTFSSTVTTARPSFIEGMFLYFYTFTLSAGTANIYHATISCPIQDVVDLWDGIYRTCIQCQDKRSGAWEDFTAEVAAVSSAAYPISTLWGGLTSTDEIILMFSSRTTAVKLSFIAGKVNAAAATLTIYYWDGSAWVSVGTVYDGTLDSGGTKTLSKNGIIYWNSPGEDVEMKTTLFNVHGYAYKLVPSNTLTTGTSYNGVMCDHLVGIPAHRIMKPYDFSFVYKDRTFLAGYSINNEGNRVDYGVPYAVDSYSGENSSENDKSMYIGKQSALVAAANIFNRFGNYLYNSELLLKTSETFLLDGDDPDTFKVYAVSSNLGCVAPRTLCTAEIAYEISKEAVRNIAMWLSARGPVIFDAAILIPLKGIDVYFDQTKSQCVNYSAIQNAHAWFDSFYNEWNLCIPSGVGQTTCNVWLFYNLVKKRWSKRDVGSQYVPQATVKVADDSGNMYTYGLLDDGCMVRLENGSLWYGTESIECSLTTCEYVPTNDIFDTTCMRRVKFLREKPSSADISYALSGVQFISYGVDESDGSVATACGRRVVEQAGLTTVTWPSGGLLCEEVREGVSLPSPYYQITGGLLEIAGAIDEGKKLSIYCATADFVAAGFVPGLLVYTSDTDFPGPYILESVTTTTLTFISSVAPSHETKIVSGSTTFTAYFFSIEHYLNGSNTPERLTSAVIIDSDRYQEVVVNCNKVGLTHKLKFTFNSTGGIMDVRPLVWGFQYLVEREAVGG